MSINPLGSLFGANPFRSMQDHMTQVVLCVDELPALFEAVTAEDFKLVAEVKDRIFAAEHAADQVKHSLRDQLPRGLFLPVNRGDLLDILDMQDSIADVAQDIAGLIYERSMTIPDALKGEIMPLVKRCVDACHQAAKIINELDELLELGFRGREATRVDEMISELNGIEEETDDMGIALARHLFRLEDDLNPVSVIFWHRLIEWIGDVADYSEKVGNRIRLLIAN